VFGDESLSLLNWRMAYSSMVLKVLLYGAESWAIKEPIIKRIETFHNWRMQCGELHPLCVYLYRECVHVVCVCSAVCMPTNYTISYCIQLITIS